MLKWAAKQRVCCTALALQRIRENRSQWVSDRRWRRRTSLRETNKRSFSSEDGGAEPAGPIPDLMIYGSKPRWNGEERKKKSSFHQIWNWNWYLDCVSNKCLVCRLMKRVYHRVIWPGSESGLVPFPLQTRGRWIVGFLTSEKKVLVGVCGFSLTTGKGPRISWLWRKIGKALIGKKVANFTTHANYTLEKVNLIAMSIWYTILYTCLLWANLCSFFFVFVLLVGASSVTRDQNKVLLWLDLIFNALVKFKV